MGQLQHYRRILFQISISPGAQITNEFKQSILARTLMKMSTGLAFLMILVTSLTYAQDEGVIMRKERINRSSSVFIGFGPSFTLGKNIGDYSTGINFEAGFLKRVNRVLSIGPSISYIGFSYDPAKTKAETAADLYTGVAGNINTWHERYDQYGLPPNYQWDYGYLLNLEGGDIALLSLAVNLKLNFIPITDHTKFSIYGFAKPFITSATRKAVSGTGERYVYEAYEDETTNQLYYATDDNIWYPDGVVDEWGPDTFPAMKEETVITGGIFIGPGVEFMPAGRVSIFAQAAFGYTFPVSYVSTESYEKTIESYTNPVFPIVKKGFPSVNIQVGLSINF